MIARRSVSLFRRIRARTWAFGIPFIRERTALLRSAFLGEQGVVRGKRVGPGAVSPFHAEVLAALVRRRRPQVVVETGVCNGLSSAAILHAMEGVQAGRLISVDLPEYADVERNTETFWEGKGGAAVAAGREVGWLVPASLRHRWRLVLGRSSDVLPGILEEEGPIDIFIHDSEHSYENQLFEFSSGWRALRPGGVLVATDINWSSAFGEFLAEAGPVKKTYIDRSFCLVEKPR